MRKGSDGGNGKKKLGKNRKKKERKKKRLMKIMATTSFASRTTTDGTPHAHAKKKKYIGVYIAYFLYSQVPIA